MSMRPLILLVPALLLLTGCGQHAYQTTAVQGIVLCNGTPVTEGQLSFSPMPTAERKFPGKGGVAVIQPDGSFVLGTYHEKDGAIIGRHRVLYLIPEPRPNSTPCGSMVSLELEIVEGMPSLTIELSEHRRKPG